MNWRRGLFRAWLVASLVWIIGGVFLVYQADLGTQLKRAVERLEIVKLKTEIKKIDQAIDWEPSQGEPSVSEFSREFFEVYGEFFSARSHLDEIERLRRLIPAALLVPPVLSFVLGLAVFWIIKGFGRPTEKGEMT